MNLDVICLRCFQHRGEYDVCPYCGYVAGSEPPQAYFLTPGSILRGRYVIGTSLGHGGFGVTYKAFDTTLGVVIAVKEFYPSGLVTRPPGTKAISVFPGDSRQSFDAQKSRFLEEARNLAKFNGDPHIVNVYDYFDENETAYIVMEYLDGQTLKEYLSTVGGKLPEDVVMRYATHLLQGLDKIHGQGIIHRDISPDNIFLLQDGRLKILDFGAARFADGKEEPEAVRSAVIKIGYTPPEQYHSKIEQGPWTDVYAAGATLYKLLTGQTPEESIERLRKDGLKRPGKAGAAVSPQMDRVVLTAMALAEKKRYQSAQEMLGALESPPKAVQPLVDKLRGNRTMSLGLLLGLIAVVLLVVALLIIAGRQPGAQTPSAASVLRNLPLRLSRRG